MRGRDTKQGAMFSYVDIEDRIPPSHPLRKLKVAVDAVLLSLDEEFAQRYATTGRPSIPPERLLRSLVLQAIYSIRSERQLVEQINYNLMYRWFVGLGIGDPVWERSVFCANRDRLLEKNLLSLFFSRVVALADWAGLVSNEHFSVDGTMIEAWASQKSFVRKAESQSTDSVRDHDDRDEPPTSGRNAEVDFRGETRSNQTHESTTDAQARLFKKAKYAEAKPRYLSHILMENRNGLIIDVETTLATGKAEREAAELMAERNLTPGSTLGADKGYDVAEHLQRLQDLEVIPHVAAKTKGSAMDPDLSASEDCQTSLRVRKRIEECFGWAKTIGGFRKTRFVGKDRVHAQALITYACWNLTRMVNLFDWRHAYPQESCA